jgi:lysophospholipase L1-like esterase
MGAQVTLSCRSDADGWRASLARLPPWQRVVSGCCVLVVLGVFGCKKPSDAGRATSRNDAVDHSQSGKIVVLGSSTSQGVGPKDSENAYLARYEAYLAREFPQFTLVNLAVGGQTTYHIQPTGFRPPAGRPEPVKGKNITAALTLTPSAIVVNMPSNDVAENISETEQLANFNRVADLAKAAHVLLWVTTTQPRDFENASQITEQQRVRDAILATFAPRALDFWTPFATAEGKIKPEYGAGDGVHLNDAAHARLRDILVKAQIPQTVLQTVNR